MADVVQFRIEGMTPELDDLYRRGIFKREEIASIVRRRQDFEYRLRRPSPLKADFLAYIEYEKQLDKLRALRKGSAFFGSRGLRTLLQMNKAKEKGNALGTDGKKSLSDGSGVRRIMNIYQLAVTRYKGDLELWFQYLEFCRRQQNGRMKHALGRRNKKMKRVLSQAIKLHPKVPGLWIYFASWEFNENSNISAARSLMQTGLRACPKSEDLWIEYLRMELTYLNKLKARKVALGEDVNKPDQKSSEASQEEADTEGAFIALVDPVGTSGEPDLQTDDKGNEDKLSRHGFLVLQAIYHGVLESIPSSLSIRKRFLEVLDTVDLVHADEVRAEVLNDLSKDFAHVEDYWDWLARLQVRDALDTKDLKGEEALNKLKKAIEVYEDSLCALPTAKMFSFYAKFCSDVLLAMRGGHDSLHHDSGADVVDFTLSALRVYEQAEVRGCLTEELACQYVSFYLQIGSLDKARNLVEKFCDGFLSNSANLWIWRISIETRWLTREQSSLSRENRCALYNLLKSPLSKLSISAAEELWLMALKMFSDDREYFQKLIKTAIQLLSADGGSDAGASVACAIVNWVLQRDGLRDTRKIYKQLLALPRPSVRFFRFCIELEYNIASIDKSSELATVRKFYDAALNIYPQDVELWRDYHSMELKAGSTETSDAVYWRAQKTLKNPNALAIIP